MARYALTIFLSAFLLFQVQPLIAKYILPWFGGGPSIWTTCMLFFQTLLVGGYLYAHLLTDRLKPQRQGIVHLVVVTASLLLLPISPGDNFKPVGGESPVNGILLLLLATVGGPYFLLASTGPLMQRWFSHSFPGRSPYRLYSLSNVGSLLALLSYPVVVEPTLRLQTQVSTWSITYAVFVALAVWCSFRMAKSETAAVGESLPPDAAEAASELSDVRPSAMRMLLWLSLSATGSAIMLATTNQMCIDVAAVPFLWVLPLSLYLLTFIICFDNPNWYDRRVFGILLVAATAALCWQMNEGLETTIPVLVSVYSAGMLACCMTCHGELVRSRPHPRYLTLFYLLVSVGGTLGGVFVAIVSPAVFTGFQEYHIALFASCAVTAIAWCVNRAWKNARSVVPMAGLQFVLAGVVAWLVMDESISQTVWLTLAGTYAALCVTGLVSGGLLRHQSESVVEPDVGDSSQRFRRLRRLVRSVRERSVRSGAWLWAPAMTGCVLLGFVLNQMISDDDEGYIHRSRNFYGVLRVSVEEDENGEYHSLSHGRIEHGNQYLDDDLRTEATTYYGLGTGVELAIRQHPRRHAQNRDERSLSIGAVGLGAGTIAALGQTGDTIRFYEINPDVLEIAQEHFTYLADSAAATDVILGDARIMLEHELLTSGSQQFDVLIIDAFSSDSIPVHLITRECVDLYKQHLKPDGLLLFHISNRYLDLEPITRALAEHLNWNAISIDSDGDDSLGVYTATWIIITANDTFLADNEVQQLQTPWEDNVPPLLWTDDFASLWQIMAE
ncbi:MAG: fused MFS/spermidine synthase [Planctomycetaceae bacterium]